LSQEHFTVVYAIDLCSIVNEYQVYLPQIAMDTYMDTVTDLLKAECVRSRPFDATCLFLIVTIETHNSKEFLVWLHKPEVVTMVAHLTLITLNT